MLTFEPQDSDVAIAHFEGERIERIYSGGEYSFSVCSIPAALAVYEYTRKEEIPLVYVGLPCEYLGELLCHFAHADVDALDAKRGFYKIAVKSEAELLAEPPTLVGDGATLSPITRDDIPDYFRLCTDEDTNKYWNYNYKDDNPEADGEWFFDEQERDFARGAALTLAVRHEGRFIGEATLYGFDLRGGAYIALRLLPEYRGRGLGSAALDVIFMLGERIGLVRLFAEVIEDNTPSLMLFSSYMDEVKREGGRVFFELSASEDE